MTFTLETIQLNNSQHVYWYPTLIPAIRTMLEELSAKHEQVILFGEILGDTIQSLHYGYKQQLGYRAFDLMIDGKYLDYDDFVAVCEQYGVEIVPLLARIPYSLDAIKALSEGPTTLLPDKKAHMREGVVVKPLYERVHRKIGRCVLKYVGDTYLLGKKTDFAEE